MSVKQCLVLFCVCTLYVLGIWIYLSGYLLKRIVVYENSTRSRIVDPNIVCHNWTSLQSVGFNVYNNLQLGCQTQEYNQLPLYERTALKRFERAVVIVIDGLRYDFTLYNAHSTRGELHYLNKLPVFSELLQNYSRHSVLLEVTADPPTTTLQRLKGLTTGSLPTFIDVGLNFASNEIVEDNLIRQLRNYKKRIVFMGDDTWENMFPGQFQKSFPYPSFNVKDLDTVDNGILEHIFSQLEEPNWDIIIAHFLGVDHCGHRFGPEHPAMAKKLSQMDRMVRMVIKHLAEDTILFVLGDHGMTSTGDHGGDSYKEVSTALFIYSPSLVSSHIFLEDITSAAQVDIVPTFSLLLGLPIPFSNLGSVIPHLFFIKDFDYNQTCFDIELDSLLGATIALAENSAQVHCYLQSYVSASGDMPQLVLETSLAMMNNLSLMWTNLTDDVAQSTYVLKKLYREYRQYLTFVRKECAQKWAVFDLETMILGIIILIFALFFNLLFSAGIAISVFLLKILSVILAIFVIFRLQGFIQNHMLYLSILFSVSFLVMVLKYSKYFIAQMTFLVKDMMSFPICIIGIMFLEFFSNSFIVYEDAILLFLLQTVLLIKYIPLVLNVFLYSSTPLFAKTKSNKTFVHKLNKVKILYPFLILCLLIFVRISTLFHKCREEQVVCETSEFLTPLENIPSTASRYRVLRLLLSLVSIILPISISVTWLKSISSTKSYTAAMICVDYAIPFICICICLHWWLAIAPSDVVHKILKGNQVVLPYSALVMSITMFCLVWFFPMLMDKPWCSPSCQVYSGSLSIIVLAVLLPLYLIAGDGLASAVSFMMFTIVSFVTLENLSYTFLTKSGYEWKRTNDSKLSGSTMWLNVITWGLFSSHWFYGTGHQPSFPSIHWQAAFLITSGEVSNYVLSGALIVLNTFSSQVICGMTLPFLLIRTDPSSCMKKSLFQLVLRYLAFHGTRILGAVVACTILRRHLMVWKIFTPRLVYETSGLLVSIVSTAIGYLFMLRTTSHFQNLINTNRHQLWLSEEE